MKFIIYDYLSQLNERDELDAVLPDLLRVMGLQIIKLAFRGEVEHGIDIAAIGSENREDYLYLFVLKAGHMDKYMWDEGPNSLRPTINNIYDVPFEDLTKPKLMNYKRKIVIVHNGVIRENIRPRFNGFIKNNTPPDYFIEYWDIDKLTDLFEEYLFNERILPIEYRRQLKRILVFLDVPDYDLSDLKELIQEILPKTKNLTKKNRDKFFGFVRLILFMIHQYSKDLNNLSRSIVAHEICLLMIWGWMYKRDFFAQRVIQEFAKTYQLYITALVEWADKISPALLIQAGLSSIGAEKVEYPMRTFYIIGNLGYLSILLGYLQQRAEYKDLYEGSVTLLTQTIDNNPSRHRPLLDNHSIDIFLGIWALIIAGREDFARWWLRDIFEHITIRKEIFKRLPELYNNIDAVIEFEATDEHPLDYIDSSSNLIYFLFELCVFLDDEDIYLDYREHYKDVNLQCWYPPDNVEEMLYECEVREGDTEVAIRLPESFIEFKLDVEARTKFDRTKYSPLEKGIPTILFLANKHYRTPVFPFWWRSVIFPEKYNDE